MKKIVGFYFVFLFLLIVNHYNFFKYSDYYRISFLDIGQGDSVFIQTPKNCRILIDSGKPNTLSDSLIHILPFNTRKVDLLIITHPDIDHYGGFTNISDKYTYTNVLLSPFPKENQSYKKLIQTLKSSNSNIQVIDSHKTTTFCNLDFHFHAYLEGNANDSSIISHITFPNDFKLLSSGDISIEQELMLINEGFPLKANIFKANHHGSKSSNHQKFLNKIKPDYFIVQSGLNNSFGHPHSSVLKSAHKAGAKILRNDLNGRIDFFFSLHKKSAQQNLELKLEK